MLVRYATYGGDGGTAAEARKTLAGTSFPGGNVFGGISAPGAADTTSDKIYKPLESFAVAAWAGFVWAGKSTSAEKVYQMGGLFPEYGYYTTQGPKFSQSMIFQQAYGPNGPPEEFVFHPTDIYLPGYFKNTQPVHPYSASALPSLAKVYDLAAQAFCKTEVECDILRNKGSGGNIAVSGTTRGTTGSLGMLLAMSSLAVAGTRLWFAM